MLAPSTWSWRCPPARFAGIALVLAAAPAVAEPPDAVVPIGGLPLRVHVFEDYETEIERRWWLRGVGEEESLPESLSASLPNRRCCRAAETKDFDDLMGDPARSYKAVIFNPVPGPPMGGNTRLAFRYHLTGDDALRVQIYSLTNGYHRRLLLDGLEQGRWQTATVDMTQARRPDGSGGPLSADERIDDIQFYVEPPTELLIDDVVLYEAAPEGERRPFPRRVIFTGWFDTGEQGAEWPGDFAIAPHDPPRTWDYARGVAEPGAEGTWVRLHLRGRRPLSAALRLRFLSWLSSKATIDVGVFDSETGRGLSGRVERAAAGEWAEAELAWDVPPEEFADGAYADEVRFRVPRNVELRIDDVLLYEPGDAGTP